MVNQWWWYISIQGMRIEQGKITTTHKMKRSSGDLLTYLRIEQGYLPEDEGIAKGHTNRYSDVEDTRICLSSWTKFNHINPCQYIVDLFRGSGNAGELWVSEWGAFTDNIFVCFANLGVDNNNNNSHRGQERCFTYLYFPGDKSNNNNGDGWMGGWVR